MERCICGRKLPCCASKVSSDLFTARAEAAALRRQLGELNDSLGVVDIVQIKPMVDGLLAEAAALRDEVEARNGELAAIWAIANETSPDDAPDPMPAWAARNAVDALEDRWHDALRERDEAREEVEAMMALLIKARKWVGAAPAEWPNDEVIEVKHALDALRARKVGG